ncbi:MAG: UDP-3-O-[3-hydroxymyristoyl] glucosamine N-acyltransferase [Chitinophagales bacterium]|jgi:UDP-3-O-[3-hydroxymyristoyl] glucosamine N-acyltransferase
MSLSLQSLATSLDLNFEGDPESIIQGVGSLSNATTSDLCFIQNEKYRERLANSVCSTVIVPLNFESLKIDKQCLFSANPQFSFVQAIHLLEPQLADPSLAPIHPSAQISDSAKLGLGVTIGALVVIGDNVVIGADTSIGAGSIIERNVKIGSHCLLHSRVTLCHEVDIGNNCILQSGVVLGGDGFGMVMHEDRWHKVPQIGTVILEDDVEIGANTAVDRGAIDDTVIGQGCKLDNLIQIGHNVRIGAHTAIAAHAAIAGSTIIGRYCQIAGCVAVAGHLNIADHVIVTGMSLVTKSINKPGVYSSGTPLQKNQDWHKSNARYKVLDKLARSVASLEKNK